MKRGILTAAFLLCLAVPASVSHAAQLAEDTIAEGVYIEDMDMSGMMVSEAIEAVDSYVKGRMDTMIPPLAVPSSLVSTIPVISATSWNRRA